jgi:hypothetical protein
MAHFVLLKRFRLCLDCELHTARAHTAHPGFAGRGWRGECLGSAASLPSSYTVY